MRCRRHVYFCAMPLTLVAALVIPGNVPIPVLDALAQKKDQAALSALCTTELAQNSKTLRFLSGGSYGEGKFGWHVFRLTEPGTGVQYAVFSTPLTCEDLGEQVFKWDGSRMTAAVPEDESLGFKVVRHDMQAFFTTSQKRASFIDQVAFERTHAGRDTFLFRLSPHYRVSSIQNERGQAVPFDQAGGVVATRAPRVGNRFSYLVRYAGVVDLYQYAGSVSSSEIILAQDYWYPTIARGAAPYSLIAHTPPGWAVIGQGARVSQRSSAKEVVTSFRMDLPTVYYSFSSGPFKHASDRIGPWTFSTWSKELSRDQLHAENILQSDVIAFYNEKYSAYPFKEWGTLLSKPYGAGALEAYSYATYGAAQQPFQDPHEPSHTWWGGILPNSYLHSQWNESFAVFSEGLFARERPLGNPSERRRAFIRDAEGLSAFNTASVAEGSPDLGPVTGALGYGKGSLVLQMLEQEIGTAKLLEAIRLWIAGHPKGDLVEWPSFEGAVNHATGKSYKWFFDQWLRQPGFPDLGIDNLKWQDGVLTGSARFNGTAYRLTLEVLLQYSDGRRELRNVVVGPGALSFSLKVPYHPVLASFDPWRRVLRRYEPDEQPVNVTSFVMGARRYNDAAHVHWLENFGSSAQKIPSLPSNLDGVFIVGSPQTTPAMRLLCKKAGFDVRGNTLTYKGATIDLRSGSAIAVVDLGQGKQCAIGLGRSKYFYETGRARLCLLDGYGRFLRGISEPKTRGYLTFSL
jgi:hypothetical protein